MAQEAPVKGTLEMLGRADITTALPGRGHVLQGMQQQAADAMDRLFARQR